MQDDEEYKCIVCNRKCQALIAVNAELDEHNIFISRRGICQKCLKETDIEKFCKNFIIKCWYEKIEKAKEHLKFLEEELRKVNEDWRIQAVQKANSKQKVNKKTLEGLKEYRQSIKS